MNILTDYKQDKRTVKTKPGGYEWWYFDGVDTDEVYRFVIIFYEGNPFSTRYIKRVKERHRSQDSFPAEHPAVSISIYENDETIYYGFTEYEKKESEFDPSFADLRIGHHQMNSDVEDGKLIYTLNLKERLPSGDRIVGQVEIKSESTPDDLLGKYEPEIAEGHYWNLVQPRGHVEAHFKIFGRNEPPKTIKFTGLGYHDHNLGEEPMRNEYLNWYWGRFHFDTGTLVYYLMDRKDKSQKKAWLISPDNQQVLQVFENISLEDFGRNVFGLKSARRILLSNENAQITIQQTTPIDNGPFYQRFDSDAFLNIPEKDIMEVAHGLSEYIRPDRIYWRVFWPLLNMRIRYKNESPHWVQQSKNLYRLTW